MISPAFPPLVVARLREPNLPWAMAAAQATRACDFSFPSLGNLPLHQSLSTKTLPLNVLFVFVIGVFDDHLLAIYHWVGV